MTTQQISPMDCTTASIALRSWPLAAEPALIYDGVRAATAHSRVTPAAGALDDTMANRFQLNRDHAGPSDELLLAAVCGRSEAALQSLYDRYADLVYTVALRMVGDRELAQEVLQDVFVRCWNRAQTFRTDRGHVGGWLIGIARNRAIDLLRSRQHQARLREQWPLDGSESPSAQIDAVEQSALRQTLRGALQSLPDAQRETIELAFYSGFTQAEIAAATSTPLGTVKTRIRDGMLRLRALLRPAMEEERRGR